MKAVLAGGLPPGTHAVAGDEARHGGERRADQAAADVRGKTLARAPQVDGVDVGQIIAPKAELGDGAQAADENAEVHPGQLPGPDMEQN